MRSRIENVHGGHGNLAIVVHGHAEVLTPAHPYFEELDELHRTYTGRSVHLCGEGVFLQVNAQVVYAYARFPGRYPE